MSRTLEVRVPDIGEAEDVRVVEVLVRPGDRVQKDDGLVTLESDKASMDIPSPETGVIQEVRLAEGDPVDEGDLVVILEVGEEEAAVAEPAEVAEGEVGGGRQEEEVAARPGEDTAAAEAPARVAGEPEEPSAAGSEPARPWRVPAAARAAADQATELVVLGSGPGGYTAAFRAADLGKEVVLVERYPTLGGVCLNVGCIPSKALLHAARVIEEAAFFADHGIGFGKPKLDLDRLRSWKAAVVNRLTEGLEGLATRRKVRVIGGEGRFASPHSLEVATDRGEMTLSFEQAIIAAGSRVIRLAGVPWEDPRVIDSTGALELGDLPRRLLVIGGGIIGLELATVYAALGSEVTLVELTDGLLPGVDRDLVKPLHKRVAERFKAIHLETEVDKIEPTKKALKASFKGKNAPGAALFDRVLVAVGRRPNGDRIGAEAAGVEIGDQGFIRVDRQQRTNVAHIFAIGDITGPPLLAHKASHQGKVAGEVAAGLKSAFDARVIPSVAYTDPEVAWAGPTESEAKEKGIPYEKGTFPWAASGRALGMGREDGLTKILFDPETRRVIGAGVVGPSAGDLISELCLAIEMGAEAADIGLTIHPHPTLSETVAFAAEAFEGTLTELYRPPRKKRS